MQAKFTDAKQRTWEINVTPYERDAIRIATDVDIYDFVNKDKAEQTIIRFETDDDFLADVAWQCVESQAQELSIDEKEFKSGFYGEILDSFVEAFFTSLTFFFRRPQQRKVIQKLLALMQHAAAKHEEIADAIGDKATEMIKEAINKIDANEVVNTSMNSAMNSQDSQESTPSRQAVEALGGTP